MSYTIGYYDTAERALKVLNDLFERWYHRQCLTLERVPDNARFPWRVSFGDWNPQKFFLFDERDLRCTT